MCPASTRYLLVGSTEAYTGKSATILGLARQFQLMGLDLAYGKPLGNCTSSNEPQEIDADVRFIAQTLNLPAERLLPTLLLLGKQTIQKRLNGDDRIDYHQLLEKYHLLSEGDLVLLEGPGTLAEGHLFDLSLVQIAEAIDAAVLLVARFNSTLTIDALLSAKQQLGDRLVGLLVDNITADQLEAFDQTFAPYLEYRGIPVLGRLPKSSLLQSVSVDELVCQLEAEVLCCSDRLDLMVESLRIGAMNVNSALKYFSKGRNMAVVTGGDRTDIQLAALETSTHCLVLTGRIRPSDMILRRARELEIPILSVDLDTLTTVEIIDNAFGKVRLHESIKVECIGQLMAEHFDLDRLVGLLGIKLKLN